MAYQKEEWCSQQKKMVRKGKTLLLETWLSWSSVVGLCCPVWQKTDGGSNTLLSAFKKDTMSMLNLVWHRLEVVKSAWIQQMGIMRASVSRVLPLAAHSRDPLKGHTSGRRGA